MTEYKKKTVTHSSRDEARRLIDAELKRIHAKWGEQNHPLIPSWIWDSFPGNDQTAVRRRLACFVLVGISEVEAKDVVEQDADTGEQSYINILREEMAKLVSAAAEHANETSDEVLLEAVQTAAVAQSIVEAVLRKRAR